MSKGFKSFFITFLVSIIIFTYGASYIFNNYVGDFIDALFGIAQSDTSEPSEDFSQTVNRPDESGSDISEESVDPNFKGASKTSLFILQNELGELDTVVVLRRKLETSKVLITAIPADMRLHVDGVYQKVRNLLKNRDIEFFKAKMEALIGINIDYYFMLPYENFEPVLELFDNYKYSIPYDMYLEKPPVVTDESGATEPIVPDTSDIVIDTSGPIDPFDPTLPEIIVDLKKGTTTLDFDVFRQLTIFRRDGVEEAHTNLMVDLFGSLFIQMFAESNADELRADIEAALPLLTTNYNIGEYDANVDAILNYSGYDKNTANYPGSYKVMADGSTQFNAEVEKAIMEFKEYR